MGNSEGMGWDKGEERGMQRTVCGIPLVFQLLSLVGFLFEFRFAW